LQQQHPHQLRIVLTRQHTCAAAGGDGDGPRTRFSERGQAGGDLCEGVVVGVVGLAGGGLVASQPGALPQPDGGVRAGQSVPRGRAQDLRRLLAVVDQEGHQLGDGPQVQVDLPG